MYAHGKSALTLGTLGIFMQWIVDIITAFPGLWCS